MSALKPIRALQLDSVQQEAFVRYFNSLTQKPPTTVRIFDRNEFYTVHGEDATTAAREVFKSTANIKQMGVEPNRMDYLVLSKGNFEILIKKLLLVRRYRVEIYVNEGSAKTNNWQLKYKGSPGNLTQMEDILSDGLGLSEDLTPCLMAVNIKIDVFTKCRLIGVACITAANYQMTVAEFTDDDLLTQLETIAVQCAPSECLVPQVDNDLYKALKKVMDRGNITITKLKKSEFSTEGLIQDLNRLLLFKENQQVDANAFPETRNALAVGSLAAAIKYLGLMTDSTNYGRFKMSTVRTESFLHLDAAALEALNVFPKPGDNSHSPSRSIYGLLDRCRTQQGKRLLAQWLRQPLRDINLINERLDIVECFTKKSQLRMALNDDHLRRFPDIQALARRLTRKKANLHDCYKIYQAINRLPVLLRCLAEAENSTVHACFAEPLSELNGDLTNFRLMVESTVDMEAAGRGEFLVNSSFDEDLGRLSERMTELQESAEREFRSAARTLELEAGRTIKMDFNAQSGFFFRVKLKIEQALRDKEKFIIIDAVKGGVRFKTEALDAISEEYVQAKTEYETEQDKVVADIVGIAAGYSECLFSLSHTISRLDVLVAFAVAAAAAPDPYTRPLITESLDQLVIENLRHPCLEIQEGVSFIPNDVVLKRDSSLLHIVTGANMGGKSTWMRSCGVAVLLAHAGSLVPASKAVIPLMRTICARVGASDREERGQSTFMLEMIETAAILRTATPDSLVLVDELGRGTSTYEGCGIAWAIAEELALKSKCFTLFATHYTELTRLASEYPNVIVNSHAKASVVDNELLLYHKIAPGPAMKSLGIHVAKLAGLPDSIIKYAESKQAEMETSLFDLGTSMMADETGEGQEMIMAGFLQKCSEINESTPDDDEMMEKLDDLTQELFSTTNPSFMTLFG